MIRLHDNRLRGYLVREVNPVAQFGLLGPLSVAYGGTEIKISAGHQRVVLAALLVWANRVVTVDRMAELLWGDELPRTADVTVRGYVKRLRAALGPLLTERVVTRASGYLISVGDDEVDLFRFEQMFRIGGEAIRQEDWSLAFEVLSKARNLWRGAPLEDIPSDRLLSEITEPLAERQIQALEWRVEAALQLGLHADSIADLVLLCEQHPTREPFRGQLMRALYMSGRQGDALNAFHEARNWLVGELGVEPGPDLCRLHERILAHDPVLGFAPRTIAYPSATPSVSPQAAPPLHGPASRGVPVSRQGPAQLPADVAEFTGRDAQVERLCELMSDAHRAGSPGAVPVALVTGTGGLGKTALAVHAAHKLVGDFPDGQLYVDLLGGTSHPLAPGQVLTMFLRSLDIEDAMVPTEQAELEALFRTRVAGRRLLILLDNARDSAQVRPLLPGTSSSVVLITTRSRLPDLPSAKLLDLDVLEDADALLLFTRIVGEERARSEPEAVRDLLRSCGGFPLAIRICAARLVARPRWTIQVVSDKVRDSRRRLDELRTGDMAIRASFQVSFDSLHAGDEEARAFRLLGLWQGAFISLEAAAALLGRPQVVIEDALETLVDACLLESSAPGRYRYHDLLRVYAAELARADETGPDRDAALTRLLEWYLHSVDAAATAIAPQRTRPPVPEVPAGLRPLVFTDVEEALDWLESERDNIVTATRQASDAGEDAMAWLMPTAAAAFFHRRGYHSDSITTHQLALVSARRTSDLRGEGYVLNNLGMAQTTLDMPAAIGYLEESLRVRRRIGDERGQAQTWSNLLDAYLHWGHFTEVVARFSEALECQQRSGVPYGEGVMLSTVAEAYLALGRVDEGIACLQNAEEIFRESTHDRGLGNVWQLLGDAYLAQGHGHEGIDFYRRAVDVLHAIRDRPGEAEALLRWGRACNRTGLHEEARVRLGQALTLFRATGDVRREAEARDELSAASGD